MIAVRFAVLVLLASSCGPIVYVGEVTSRASTAVEHARDAQADTLAPYWWTRAVEYLHEARELAAHADFQGANKFGRLAAEAADKAIEEASLAVKDPSKRPITVQPAPAKETP